MLAEARPSTSALAERLEKLDSEELELFQVSYELAMQVITEYWQGVRITERDLVYSEDRTEDFCSWVVSEGREVWVRSLAVNDLADLAREEMILEEHPEVQRQQGRPQWDSDPRWVAHRLYDERYANTDRRELHGTLRRLMRNGGIVLRPRGVAGGQAQAGA